MSKDVILEGKLKHVYTQDIIRTLAQSEERVRELKELYSPAVIAALDGEAAVMLSALVRTLNAALDSFSRVTDKVVYGAPVPSPYEASQDATMRRFQAGPRPGLNMVQNPPLPNRPTPPGITPELAPTPKV